MIPFSYKDSKSLNIFKSGTIIVGDREWGFGGENLSSRHYKLSVCPVMERIQALVLQHESCYGTPVH
eukprot:scaffold270594_cov14-Tisochrysis_lutea.AAC.1